MTQRLGYGVEYQRSVLDHAYDTINLRKSPVFPVNHVGAVNCLAIDTADRQFLLSGGGDSSIKVWDLNAHHQIDESTGDRQVEMAAEIPRKSAHQFGVSGIEWWPNETGMFISSSFDNTVKVWDANCLQEAYSWNLDTKVYTISSNATNKLIATAADHPLLRLLDLRTTAYAHTLTGHAGKVLAVSWSPTNEHILASGGADGTVRLWDIRRASACVCQLDMQKVQSSTTTHVRRIQTIDNKKAHRSAVNGLCWFPNGDYLVSSGNDEKLRVWGMAEEGGENMLINFGPLVRNRHLQTLNPCLSPAAHGEWPQMPYLFFPSDSGEIFMFQATTGRIVKRLSRGAQAQRSACIVARGGDYIEYYSGGLDGTINCWCPQAESDVYEVWQRDDTLNDTETVGDALNKLRRAE